MGALETYLKHERLAHIRIDGGVNKKLRDQLVCRFQEDSTVSIYMHLSAYVLFILCILLYTYNSHSC